MKQEEDNSKVIDISNIKMIKTIQEQVPEEILGDESTDSLNKALNESKQRAQLYDIMQNNMEKELFGKHNITPDCCYNKMCQFCCPNEHKCTENNHHPVDCPFRMISHPPNIMDYDEYIPSHREALDMLEKNGLLKGDREEYLKANLYYGKAKNYEERDKTEVKGITMAQAREAIKTAINESFQYLVSEGELSQEIVDNFIVPEVIASNATCELEKAMGIYPNIKIHKR